MKILYHELFSNYIQSTSILVVQNTALTLVRTEGKGVLSLGLVRGVGWLEQSFHYCSHLNVIHRLPQEGTGFIFLKILILNSCYLTN